MLYYTMLCYAMLCYAILYYTILYMICYILYTIYNMLYYTTADTPRSNQVP